MSYINRAQWPIIESASIGLLTRGVILIKTTSRALALALIVSMVSAFTPLPVVHAESKGVERSAGVHPTMSTKTASHEILVKFKPGVSDATADAEIGKAGASEVASIAKLNLKKVRVPPGLATEKALSRLKSSQQVLYAEPNYVRHALLSPNDEYYVHGQQWWPKAINEEAAWDSSRGDGVIVAVVDTGVDYTHPDLAGKIIKGRDFVNNDYDPMDDEGHGTHVAGIIAAATNNKKGIAGTGWNAKVLAIKALDSNGWGNDFRIAEGIRYAADHGARVINLSLGDIATSKTLDEAAAYARDKNVVVFAAAGNGGYNVPYYPAGSPGVVGVAATRKTPTGQARSSFSNFSSVVDIAAPGQNILSTIPHSLYGAYYDYYDGTSMATAVASGAAAVAIAKYPLRKGADIARLMMETSRDMEDPGRDDDTGYGVIDVASSVTASLATLEESSSKVSFSGSWSGAQNDRASSGAYRYSATAGSSANVTFSGTRVIWVARKGPDQGIASLEIDGNSVGNVDLYAPETEWQSLAYTATGLVNDQHALKITATGDRNTASKGSAVNVDAFDFSDLVRPTVPTTLRATATSANSVSLSWSGASDNSGLVFYSVQRSPNGSTGWAAIANTSMTYYKDTGLGASKTYYYRIVAKDSASNASPASPIASATTQAFVTSDVNADVRSDGIALYNYGSATTGALVFKSAVSTNAVKATFAPSLWWKSAQGGFDLAKAKSISGDFNGDGRADILALKNDGATSSSLWLLASTGASYAAPKKVFSSSQWAWANNKLLDGDFNGDGKDELVSFYTYGGTATAAFVFEPNANGTLIPRRIFDSKSWDWARMKPIAVKNGGVAKVMAAYDYGQSKTALFLFERGQDGMLAPIATYVSDAGGWDFSRSRFLAADIDGDLRADVVAFYNYDRSVTKAFLFKATGQAGTKSLAAPVEIFASSSWDWTKSTFISGDFNGDGRGDAAASFNNADGSIGLWIFASTGGKLSAPLNVYRGSQWNNQAIRWLLPY